MVEIPVALSKAISVILQLRLPPDTIVVGERVFLVYLSSLNYNQAEVKGFV